MIRQNPLIVFNSQNDTLLNVETVFYYLEDFHVLYVCFETCGMIFKLMRLRILIAGCIGSILKVYLGHLQIFISLILTELAPVVKAKRHGLDLSLGPNLLI